MPVARLHQQLVAAAICLLSAASPSRAEAHGGALVGQAFPLAATVLAAGGVCVTFSYDANGNRTAQVSSAVNTGPTTWGSGSFGCFSWHS